jgi:peptidoglycan/LPS O-acetylase OafA/YrhL
MKTRMFHLDLIRALAILIIVIFIHMPFFLKDTNAYSTLQQEISLPTFQVNLSMIQIFGFYLSYFGLSLFIFISGYSIYMNNHYFKSSEDIFNFWRKRAIRIFPLFWIAFIVSLVLF